MGWEFSDRRGVKFKRPVIHDFDISNIDHAVDGIIKLLACWQGIVGRCTKESHGEFKNYGAKGIKLCAEWSGSKGRTTFAKWALHNGWKPGLVIDRINGKKGYSPKNCRCVTAKENSRNKINNRMLTYQGERKCLTEWSEDPRCHISLGQLYQRLKCGWSMERAMITPLRVNIGGRYAHAPT